MNNINSPVSGCLQITEVATEVLQFIQIYVLFAQEYDLVLLPDIAQLVEPGSVQLANVDSADFSTEGWRKWCYLHRRVINRALAEQVNRARPRIVTVFEGHAYV